MKNPKLQRGKKASAARRSRSRLQRVVLRLLDDKDRQCREILALRKAARTRKAHILLCQLRAHIEPAYKAKHGRSLSYDSGWAWEMSMFIQNHFDALNTKPQNDKISEVAGRKE